MNGMDNNIQNGNVSNNNVPVNNGSVMGNNMDSNSPKKSNTKFIVIGVVVAVLLIAVVGGLFGYKSYVGKPLNLYKGAIENLYEDFNEALGETESFDITKESLVMNGDVKLTSNMAELNDYTKYTYDFNLGLDVKNKKMELGASMDEGSKEIIGAVIYLLDKTMYLDSDQIYDKVLYEVMEEDIFAELTSEEGTATVDYEDVDKIVEKLSQYLSNSLDEKNFKEESATITVNGKEVKVTKVIYPLNQNTVYAMAQSILKDIKADDEFIGLVAKVAGLEKTDLKAALDELEISKEDFEVEEEIKFYLYKKGFFAKVVGFGIEDSKTVVTYAKVDKLAELNVKGDGLEVVAKTNDTKTNGSVKVEGTELATFTLVLEEKDKNVKMDLTVNMDYEGSKITVKCVADTTEESDKKAKGTYDVTLSMTEEGQTIELGAKVNLNVEIGGKVDGFDTNGAVDYTTLTDAELEKIQTNLETALEGTFLYDLVFAEDDYDDYYADDEWSTDDDWATDDDGYYEDEDSDF